MKDIYSIIIISCLCSGVLVHCRHLENTQSDARTINQPSLEDGTPKAQALSADLAHTGDNYNEASANKHTDTRDDAGVLPVINTQLEAMNHFMDAADTHSHSDSNDVADKSNSIGTRDQSARNLGEHSDAIHQKSVHVDQNSDSSEPTSERLVAHAQLHMNGKVDETHPDPDSGIIPSDVNKHTDEHVMTNGIHNVVTETGVESHINTIPEVADHAEEHADIHSEATDHSTQQVDTSGHASNTVSTASISNDVTKQQTNPVQHEIQASVKETTESHSPEPTQTNHIQENIKPTVKETTVSHTTTTTTKSHTTTTPAPRTTKTTTVLTTDTQTENHESQTTEHVVSTLENEDEQAIQATESEEGIDTKSEEDNREDEDVAPLDIFVEDIKYQRFPKPMSLTQFKKTVIGKRYKKLYILEETDKKLFQHVRQLEAIYTLEGDTLYVSLLFRFIFSRKCQEIEKFKLGTLVGNTDKAMFKKEIKNNRTERIVFSSDRPDDYIFFMSCSDMNESPYACRDTYYITMDSARDPPNQFPWLQASQELESKMQLTFEDPRFIFNFVMTPCARQ